MSEIKKITDELIRFRDERNWEQFHNSKDLALAISIEAAELNELFLWKSVEECEKTDKALLRDEIADILAYTLLLAHKHGFNVSEIVLDKIKKNGLKYPVDKSKNSAKKYTDL